MIATEKTRFFLAVCVSLITGCATTVSTNPSGNKAQIGLSGIGGLEARTCSARVVKYEDCYEVSIFHEGTCLLLPITPEGPFPRVGDVSKFCLTGPGRPIKGGRKFVLSIDGIDLLGKYKSGFIVVNEQEKTIQMSASLRSINPFKEGNANHSGLYKCTFDIGSVEALNTNVNFRTYSGKMVKFIAQTSDSSHCIFGTNVVKLDGDFRSKTNYEFMGKYDCHYWSGEVGYSLAVYRSLILSP
jgi:hypothetical protein